MSHKIIGLTAFVLMSIIIASSINHIGSTYGSGSFVESRPYMPSEHSLSLAYNITNIITNNEPHTLFTLGLIDEEQQESVRFVKYGIEAFEVSANEKKMRIMAYDVFYTAENDTLILDITHREGETRVFGTRDDFIPAWKTDPNSDSIRMFMALEQDANYLMHVEVVGANSPRGLFLREEIASIDIYFDVKEDDSGKVMIVPGELVVVPEFPYHIVLLVSAVIGSIIAISRAGLHVRFYGDGN